MFKTNDGHLQTDMFSSLNQLPEKGMRRLEESWAATFYRDFFCRIDEHLFADLYSDQPSRPNVPVNVLVGFEALKAGHGWTDEQAYDAMWFDLQVRHALGMQNLSEEVFTLRTVYNFRRAVAQHAARTGENLFEKVFVQVTGEQQDVYEVGSTKLRMDSTQIASNIRNMSRLQLLVEVLHRVHRMLDETDQARLAEAFEPYTKDSSKKYAYRMRGDQPPIHIIRIGRFMATLREDLKVKYGDRDEYRMLDRVFGEHFFEGNASVLQRANEDISAQSLQSPDDPEATFRRKSGRSYRGYVANLTETCDEDNKVQLIVDVAVEPNSADDGAMLVEAADELADRTEVKTLYTDGGYNGPEVDKKLAKRRIEQIQTGIRGKKATRPALQDFDWEVDEQQLPVAVTCPGGQRVDVERGRTDHTFVARYDKSRCHCCSLLGDCPTQPLKRRPERVLRFTTRQAQAAQRVRRSHELKKSGTNPRAAVEATVWSTKAPLPRGRVPYRGQARVAMYMIASAAMVNVRRLTARRAKSLVGTSSSSSTRSSDVCEHVLAAFRRITMTFSAQSANQRHFARLHAAGA